MHARDAVEGEGVYGEDPPLWTEIGTKDFCACRCPGLDTAEKGGAHCLDDFLTLGAPGSTECQENLEQDLQHSEPTISSGQGGRTSPLAGVPWHTAGFSADGDAAAHREIGAY